jgi:hypothetical protein
MLAEVEPLFSLANAAQKLSVDLALKSCPCLLEKDDCSLNI